MVIYGTVYLHKSQKSCESYGTKLKWNRLFSSRSLSFKIPVACSLRFGLERAQKNITSGLGSSQENSLVNMFWLMVLSRLEHKDFIACLVFKNATFCIGQYKRIPCLTVCVSKELYIVQCSSPTCRTDGDLLATIQSDVFFSSVLVTTSKALVTSSVALVSSSFLFLLACK